MKINDKSFIPKHLVMITWGTMFGRWKLLRRSTRETKNRDRGISHSLHVVVCTVCGCEGYVRLQDMRCHLAGKKSMDGKYCQCNIPDWEKRMGLE